MGLVIAIISGFIVLLHSLTLITTAERVKRIEKMLAKGKSDCR
jgi:hypothetical protein